MLERRTRIYARVTDTGAIEAEARDETGDMTVVKSLCVIRIGDTAGITTTVNAILAVIVTDPAHDPAVGTTTDAAQPRVPEVDLVAKMKIIRNDDVWSAATRRH